MDLQTFTFFNVAQTNDSEICGLNKFEHCTGCNEPIFDKFLMRIGDQFWHESCLNCCICGTILSTTCFSRGQKIYCKYDYESMFTIKCSRCQQQIKSNNLIMRAQHFVYHIDCFQCDICLSALQKGDHFIVDPNGKLICEKDFDLYTNRTKLIFMATHHVDRSLDLGLGGYGREPDPDLEGDAGIDLEADIEIDADADADVEADPDEMMLYENSHGMKIGSKRPRTILTTIQRKLFKAAFDLSPKPCRKTRENLAKETGLNIRVVQVWFQNQRAKIKKIEKKTKLNLNSSNSSSSNSNPILSTPNRKNKHRNRHYSKSSMVIDSSINSYSDVSIDDSSVLSDSYSMNDVDVATDSTPFNLKSPMDHLFSMQNFYFEHNDDHIGLI